MAAALPFVAGNYALTVGSEIAIFVIFAASLHFLMSVGGLASFGHAAYFGLGAYGVAFLAKMAGLPMIVSLLLGPLLGLLGAAVFGFFAVQLSGVYFAMLTLAFAQIVWSIAFQWVTVTGGDNGILGVWPEKWAASPSSFYWLSLGIAALAVAALRVIVFSPFGFALRATRDSPLRSEAIGINGKRVQWTAFVIAGTVAGIAGALFAYLKGSVFPDNLGISLSVDALVMVLLGGVETVSGAVVGAIVYKALNIWLVSQTDLSKLVLGGFIVLIVVVFPKGIVGMLETIRNRRQSSSSKSALADLRDRDRRMSMVPTLLSVENLTKSYGGVHAVRGVSFQLRAGEILALIGPNGAGKSTCFDMLNGQNIPDSGRIRLLGEDTAGRKPRAIWRLGVGRTFQITATFPTMTVRENVQVALVSYGGQLFNLWTSTAAYARDEAGRLLDLVGMGAYAERPCGELAYGDLKRLELAIALANQPKLLLMDEPTAGMAPRERIELMRLTARIAREQSIGVLFTEHDMDVVFEHADRILVLNRGTLIAEGSPEEVRGNPQVRAIYLGEGLVYDARHREGAGA